MEEIVIEIDKTRFQDDGIQFIVKAKIEAKTDTWSVLQCSLGVRIGGFRNAKPKYIEVTGDKIREQVAKHAANIAIDHMSTYGVQTVVRHNKPTRIERLRAQPSRHKAFQPLADAKKTSRLGMIHRSWQKISAQPIADVTGV